MIDLSLIWILIIGLGVLIYVVLDGFDPASVFYFPLFPIVRNVMS